MSQDKLLSLLDDETYEEFKRARGDITKLSDTAYEQVKLASQVAKDFDAGPLKMPKQDHSMIASGLQGAAETMSFGLDDEMGGLATAAAKGLTGKGFDYEKERDRIRDSKQSLEDANPNSYLTGSIAGGFAAPGMGAAKVGSSLLKRAAVGGASGAVQGGVNAYGNSDADNFQDQLIDTATGTALGGVVGGAASGLAAAAPGAARWGMKKLGRVAADVPEEASERYLANPNAIKNAKGLTELTDEFLGKADDVSKDLSKQSSTGFKELSKHSSAVTDLQAPLILSSSDLAEKGIIGGERKSAMKFLNGLTSDLDSLADETGNVTLDKGKQIINVLDAEIERMSRTGADAQVKKVFLDARKGIDTFLKKTSPEYKEVMVGLADDTRAYKDIAGKFRSEKGAENTLKRVMRGKDEYSKRALEKFDDQFDTNYIDDLKDSYTKDAFDKTRTNGSRRTLGGAVLGGAAGAMMGGPFGSAVGSSAGAAVGAAADKYAGIAYQKLLDGSLKVSPKLKTMLDEAAKHSRGSFILVNKMLMEQSPEYRSQIEDQSAK